MISFNGATKRVSCAARLLEFWGFSRLGDHIICFYLARGHMGVL